MYDSLLFILQDLRGACDAVWPAGDQMMWSFLFMADWARGLITDTQFIEMMGYVGVMPNGDDYNAVAACMVDYKNGA